MLVYKLYQLRSTYNLKVLILKAKIMPLEKNCYATSNIFPAFRKFNINKYVVLSGEILKEKTKETQLKFYKVMAMLTFLYGSKC